MTTESTDPAATAGIVVQLVQLLTPLSTADRQRAIAAAMIVLDEPTPVQMRTRKDASEHPSQDSDNEIHPKGTQWMTKNGITRAQLDHVFSIDASSMDVIASKLPGKSKRQQTVDAYVLCGLKSYLSTAEMTFADKDARDICNKVGCYDSANHSNYMKAFGNLVAGSKDGGWKLTNPGLAHAASVVKEAAGDANA